jgi:hypothetical protein
MSEIAEGMSEGLLALAVGAGLRSEHVLLLVPGKDPRGRPTRGLGSLPDHMRPAPYPTKRISTLIGAIMSRHVIRRDQGEVPAWVLLAALWLVVGQGLAARP